MSKRAIITKTAWSVLETDVFELAQDPDAFGLDEEEAEAYILLANSVKPSQYTDGAGVLYVPASSREQMLLWNLLLELSNMYDDIAEKGSKHGDARFARMASKSLGTLAGKMLMPGVRYNPGASVSPALAERYERFHDVEPDSVTDTRLWMPGAISLMGTCLDCGYSITDRRSKKSGRYVHDHEGSVKLYKRAGRGDRVSKTMSPPKQVFVLGSWLGCTYVDDGKEIELRGSKAIKACTDNGKRLFAIHKTKGCLYVISGGSFKITDWMYD